MKVSSSALAGLDDVVNALKAADTRSGETIVFERDAIDVGAIRRRLNMTQKEFAVSFGFPLKTLQNWEQVVREPDGPARAYLIVIDRKPEVVLEALRTADRASTH